MSRRFGKKRVPGCQCDYRFTCAACLRDAATIPPHTLDKFNAKRDEAQREVPFPVAAKDRREMEERFGFARPASPAGG